LSDQALSDQFTTNKIQALPHKSSGCKVHLAMNVNILAKDKRYNRNERDEKSCAAKGD
jgi:hypothetical protein